MVIFSFPWGRSNAVPSLGCMHIVRLVTLTALDGLWPKGALEGAGPQENVGMHLGGDLWPPKIPAEASGLEGTDPQKCGDGVHVVIKPAGECCTLLVPAAVPVSRLGGGGGK